MTCSIEGCLCKQTVTPITEAVYGKRPKRHKQPYEQKGGTTPIWRAVSRGELDTLARRFPKARRFAARRKKEEGAGG